MTIDATAGSGDPEIVTVDSITTAVVHGTVPFDRLTDFYDTSFRAVSEAIQRQGRQHTTAGFGRYFGEPADTVELEVGFGTDQPIEPDGDVRPATLPAGRCARMVHVGGYDGLGASWQKLADWIVAEGHQPGGTMWEEYVTMPTPDGDPNELRTVLTWPLAG